MALLAKKAHSVLHFFFAQSALSKIKCPLPSLVFLPLLLFVALQQAIAQNPGVDEILADSAHRRSVLRESGQSQQQIEEAVTAFLIQNAQQRLQNNPADALLLLADSHPQFRSEEFYQTVTVAIANVTNSLKSDGALEQTLSALLDPLVSRLLRELEAKRPDSQTIIDNCYITVLTELLSRNDSTRFRNIVAQLDRRPNFSKQLKQSYIDALASRRLTSFQQSLLREAFAVQQLDNPTVVEERKTRNWFRALTAAVFLAAIYLLSLLVKRYRLLRRTKGRYQEVPAEADEYSRLLAIFDLNEQATEEEMKAAFRQKAKLYHPDRQLASGEKTTENPEEKFRELKWSHERLLEIRRSFFR